MMRSIHGFQAPGHASEVGDGESGFSLIEALVAAALLLVIAVSVLPLFTRALESNLSGGRSSQLSTFAGADIESVNQEPVDQAAWVVATAPGGVVDLGTTFWDIGPVFTTLGVPDTLGDEKWVESTGSPPVPLAPVGPVPWRRNISVRKYSLSDLQILAGTDTAEDELTAVGNPMLFDSPLTSDDNAHIIELRVSIGENRGAIPVSSGQRITISHLRAF